MTLLIVPFSSMKITCPKCDSETRYRRTGGPIYGEEGTYCWECEEYVEHMIKRNFPKFFELKEDEIEYFTKQYSGRIKKLYLKQEGKQDGKVSSM
jgi:hypothetical protein